MSSWEAIIYGLGVAIEPNNLLFCLLGVVVGTLVGVLPGIGPVGALAVLMPATLGLPAVTAVIMLAGIYYGAMYGGSTTSILVNIPGEAASIVTTIDGYQMALRGRAGPALAIAAIGSFIAATVSICGLAFLAPPLAKLALVFRSPEYVGLVVLGLSLLVYVSSGSKLKAYSMAALGIILGCMGSDPVEGVSRFTFGIDAMLDGIGLVPLLVGLFGVSEVLYNLCRPEQQVSIDTKIGSLMPSRTEWKDSAAPIARGTVIGFLIGLLPGANAIIASIASYGIEKRVSKTPERFGKGAIAGVAGPESANNAAAVSAMVPLLTLGIPTNAVNVLLLAALMIRGVLPGPTLISKAPEVFWGTVSSMYIGNLMLLVLNLPLIGLWVRLVQIPYSYLFPCIVLFCVFGAYATSNNPFDIFVMMFFGVVGLVFRLLDYEPAPLVLAYVLTPIFEDNLRRTLISSSGSFEIFFERPIALGMLLAAAAIALLGALPRRKVRTASLRSGSE